MSTSDWSLPEIDVFEQIRTTLANDDAAVLATVIAVDGSAYRRPGAKMLIQPDGGGAGSITAGCLEDEVRALATDVLDDGAPRVETWDLTGDDDDTWGLGIGCNGVITVLLEPLDESYQKVVDARQAGEAIGVATVVSSETDTTVGDRGYYVPDDGVTDGLPEPIRDSLAESAKTLVSAGNSETLTVDTDAGSVDVFVDGVRPPPELVVFGSGHDVGPVIELARLVDFRTTVVSFRGGQATEDRFPQANTVVSSSPREVQSIREWDSDTYAVVMSHNFLDDRLTLEQLMETSVPYIGLMGPQERFDEMHEDIADENESIPDAELERIYTPIGVSLGGDTPYQIAFSIVAELLAVVHDRTPQHLSRREGPIHDRVSVETD